MLVKCFGSKSNVSFSELLEPRDLVRTHKVLMGKTFKINTLRTVGRLNESPPVTHPRGRSVTALWNMQRVKGKPWSCKETKKISTFNPNMKSTPLTVSKSLVHEVLNYTLFTSVMMCKKY